MGLFGKLKEILFDEETVEIPVITKETQQECVKKNTKRLESMDIVESRVEKSSDDEVIIKKIETPIREVNIDSFDMPKLKDDEIEPVKEPEKRVNTFTFPIFEDDEDTEIVPKGKNKKAKEEDKPKKEPQKGGYTNAYDYSYGKYKGDYKSSKESTREYLTKAVGEKEEYKNFKPSPIISPVYGILNQNYKKEDIITKSEKRDNTESLDLDSVRRKAYGTLEDEIEKSLNSIPQKEEEPATEVKGSYLDDDGISIDDLLMDDDDVTIETKEEEMELFNVLDDNVREEIDFDDELDDANSYEERQPELDVESASHEEEKTMEKTVDYKDESVTEDDLFDLIDSLYEGKDDD